jgi:Type IV secretion system pilin
MKNLPKIQCNKIAPALAVGFFLFLFVGLVNPQPVSAQQSIVDSVFSHCKKKAKKAAGSCKVAAEQSVNKATYNCKKAKEREACIKRKANTYIDKAAKGNPTDAKFKTALGKVLDKTKGSTTVPYTFPATSGPNSGFYGGKAGQYQCGGDDVEIITTQIDFGCLGPDEAPEDMNAIIDLALAIVRFLSVGVGLVVVASIIYAGIQYSSSEGSPEQTKDAKSRVRNAIIGLIVYIFGFSIIQFLVPGGVFN